MMELDDITYRINGCAMKVHNTLGNGFQEVIYQRCLAIELEAGGARVCAGAGAYDLLRRH